MRVMGHRRSDEEILKQVKEVSDDPKNNSLEFNEFLKMVALDLKSDATKNKNELLDAFRLTFTQNTSNSTYFQQTL